mmetsp:Transcript_4976/g.6628  ORF Transcript_4976/g.6628 Transcript_4976/m.6628 type:complete len:174 (+) Transcript_4976:217-738(+)
MTDEHMRETYEYYVKAFTEPSFEYIYAYLRLAVLLGCVTWALWFFFGPDRKPNVMVGLDEVQDKKSDDFSDEKKKGQGSTTRGDTHDTTKAETEGNTTEYRSMSLKREMDRKGPFELTSDQNMLKRDSFIKLSAILQKHVWIKFGVSNRELLDNRYSLYQDRRCKDYDKCIST